MRSNWLKLSALIAAALSIAFAVTASSAAAAKTTKKPTKAVTKRLPKLLDLGATKCVPCKMMAPILEEIEKEYKSQLEVEFIDVWKDQKAAERYKVRSIPTQIFYDEKGKEFSRHVGFFSKEDILKTFQKQGIKLKKPLPTKKAGS